MSTSPAVGQPRTVVFTGASVRVAPSHAVVGELWANDGTLVTREGVPTQARRWNST